MSYRLSIDTETGLIAPGVVVPPLVCLTWARRKLVPTPAGPEVMVEGPIVSGLVSAAEAPEFVAANLAAGATLVGQNIAYDLAVLIAEAPELREPVLRAYAEDRIRDTMLAEQLLDIATGRFRAEVTVDEATGEVTRTPVEYGLGALAKRYLGRELDKGSDGWRLRFLELLDVPFHAWPDRARDYACDDAIATLEVDEQQSARPEAVLALRDLPAQCRAAYVLHKTAARGLCVDLAAVDALERELVARRDAARAALAATGIYRANGTKDMEQTRRLVADAYGRKGEAPPSTPSGDVSTAALTLRESGDATLVALADLGKIEKQLTAFVPGLRCGANAPLTGRYNLLETGRTSYGGAKVGTRKGVNIQTLPREGEVRAVFEARPGYLLCSVDYSALELRTLAQACITMVGYSALAEAFKAGRDPHLELAAEILGTQYADAEARFKAGDKAVKVARQNAKPANFGFPGGLGVKRFRDFALATYGLRFTDGEAYRLRERWRARWPEVVEYQARVAAACDPMTSTTDVRQLVSGRVRAGCSYTEACNSFFQGLAADLAKHALWLIETRGSELIKPVAFIHDEVLAEVPEARAHEAAHLLRALMLEAYAAYCPDVPGEAEPALARRWFKDMAPVYLDGCLVPWSPELVAAQAFARWVGERGAQHAAVAA